VTFVDEQLEAILATGIQGVAVVGGGVEAAAGVADVRIGEPLTARHRFRIGSVTKIFVATLLLQLVAEGILELDGPAVPFVDDVTIRQLLNHTSGLPDVARDMVEFFEPWRRDPEHRWELGRLDELQLALAQPREFAPGRAWAYHGSNYLALGLVAERATGLTLRDALRERVFEPLGLERTDLVEESLRGDCARGYLDGDNPILPAEGLVDVTGLDLPFYRAGGGVVSTPVEVARLLQALLGGELLPAHLRAEMLDAVDSDWPETDRYGLGIGEITSLMRRERSPCGPAWGHLGFSLGYVAVALASEDGERQVVLCASGQPVTEESEAAFFEAAGRLVWHLYCDSAGERRGR
jgi:D-alanyl-D-alanine carboxypeptidase